MSHPYEGRRVAIVAAAVGALGLLLSAVAFSSAPEEAAHAWLTAVAFAVSVSLGALIFLMTCYAAGSRWPVAVRRITEAVAGGFVPLAVSFVPILLFAGFIYQWMSGPSGEAPRVDEWLEHQRVWLNRPFFAARALFYFAVWATVAFCLRRWSLAADTAPRATPDMRAKTLSAGGLPVVGLTLTFAAFDWLMSLDSAWVSSVFGVYWFSGGFVASLGLIAALTERGARHGALCAAITRSHFHALGRLIFSFSIFWAYIAFFQAMLIQMADKPDEVTFYLDRIDGGWAAVVVLLIVGRFIVPFVVLLPRRMKENSAVVSSVGGWIVAMHYVDVYWMVAPKSVGHGPLPGWIDLAALAAVVGSVVAFVAWRLSGKPLLAIGDPHLGEALAYRSPE
ncbi:MAG: hypothetical protein HOV80_23240 [Polyangiaceae bacterium]|nr:hypothetical protein [Polyangiaceae bacterium]